MNLNNNNCLDTKAVIKKLINSEEDFVNEILILNGVIQAFKESGFKNKEEIFSNIEDIMLVHKQLLTQLKAEKPSAPCILKTFNFLAKPLETYHKIYTADSLQTDSKLEKLSKTKLYNKFHNDIRVKSIPLKVYLEKPVKRLKEYRALLQPLKLELDDEQTQQLECISSTFDNILLSAKNNAKEKEGMERILAIQKKLTKPSIELVQPNRRLIKESNVTIGKDKNYKLFLFTDTFLLIKETLLGKYEPKFVHPITDVTTFSITDDCPSFQLAHETTILTITCASPTEAQEWIKRLEELKKKIIDKQTQDYTALRRKKKTCNIWFKLPEQEWSSKAFQISSDQRVEDLVELFLRKMNRRSVIEQTYLYESQLFIQVSKKATKLPLNDDDNIWEQIHGAEQINPEFGTSLDACLSFQVPKKTRRSTQKQNERRSVITTPLSFTQGFHVSDDFEWNDISEFNFDKNLGRGAFGAVYSARHPKLPQFTLAIKQMYLAQTSSIEAEISVLKACKHPTIVQYFGCAKKPDTNEFFILMEFAERGSLDHLIRKMSMTKKIDEPFCVAILSQILQGLHYLHFGNSDHQIIHRDLKPGNVLICETGALKLADFGVSSKIHESKRNLEVGQILGGTPAYLAPESLNSKTSDHKIDIWALGMIAIELCEFKNPFCGLPQFRLYKAIMDNDPPKLQDPSSFSPTLSEFISLALQKNPQDRPDSNILMDHPLLQPVKQKEQKIILQVLLFFDTIKTNPSKHPSSAPPTQHADDNNPKLPPIRTNSAPENNNN